MKKNISIIVVSAVLSTLLMVWTSQAQVAPGTINAKQSGTWNITNISGTISLPTGAATEASLVKLPLAQGSTTSGQSGVLDQGAVTTAAPTYTTGQTSPLSLTTGGLLRVDASGTTIPVTSGAVGTFFAGQQAVTASAVALATNSAKQVCVKALTANGLTVYIGPSGVTTSTGMELAAGDSQCLGLNNSNLIFVIASSTGSSVSFNGIN